MRTPAATGRDARSSRARLQDPHALVPPPPVMTAMSTDHLAVRLAPHLTSLLAEVDRLVAADGRREGVRLFVRAEVLDPALPTEVRGGLVREDGAAQVPGAWTVDCSGPLRRFLREAAAAGAPLSRVELTRAPLGARDAWTAGLEQVMTEYRVRPERIRLDGLVYRAMIRAAGPLWDAPGEKTLSFGVRPGDEPRLTILTATERRRLTPPTELLDPLIRICALYRAHGRTLTWPEWEVEGVPGDYQLQSSLPYRVVPSRSWT